MILYIFIPYILIAIAGFFNGMSDKIRHKYKKTIWSRIKNKKFQQWANPAVSHRNKYFLEDKNIPKTLKKLLTLIFKSVLVWTTDLWHLLKTIWILCFISLSAFSLEISWRLLNASLLEIIINLLFMWTLYSCFFHLSYMGDHGDNETL
jgi:hypothetical protein